MKTYILLEIELSDWFNVVLAAQKKGIDPNSFIVDAAYETADLVLNPSQPVQTEVSAGDPEQTEADPTV